MTWTNITNAQLAIGAPVRSIDLLALRDNITAQANGDAGAPQQQTASIANNAITAPKISFNSNGLRANGSQLDISCPTFNTIGSYVMAMSQGNGQLEQGVNYAAGSADFQIRPGSFFNNTTDGLGMWASSGLSGTWKWMAGTTPLSNGTFMGIACRVS